MPRNHSSSKLYYLILVFVRKRNILTIHTGSKPYTLAKSFIKLSLTLINTFFSYMKIIETWTCEPKFEKITSKASKALSFNGWILYPNLRSFRLILLKMIIFDQYIVGIFFQNNDFFLNFGNRFPKKWNRSTLHLFPRLYSYFSKHLN